VEGGAAANLKSRVEMSYPPHPPVPSGPIAPAHPPVPSGPIAPAHPPVPSGPIAPAHPPVPSGPVVITKGYKARSKLNPPFPVFRIQQSFSEIIESVINYFNKSSAEKSDIIIYITVLKLIVSDFYDALYNTVLKPEITGASDLATIVFESHDRLTSKWRAYEIDKSLESLSVIMATIREGIVALDSTITRKIDEIIVKTPVKIPEFIKCVNDCKLQLIGRINYALSPKDLSYWNGIGGTRRRRRQQRRRKTLRKRSSA